MYRDIDETNITCPAGVLAIKALNIFVDLYLLYRYVNAVTGACDDGMFTQILWYHIHGIMISPW